MYPLYLSSLRCLASSCRLGVRVSSSYPIVVDTYPDTACTSPRCLMVFRLLVSSTPHLHVTFSSIIASLSESPYRRLGVSSSLPHGGHLPDAAHITVSPLGVSSFLSRRHHPRVSLSSIITSLTAHRIVALVFLLPRHQ